MRKSMHNYHCIQIYNYSMCDKQKLVLFVRKMSRIYWTNPRGVQFLEVITPLPSPHVARMRCFRFRSHASFCLCASQVTRANHLSESAENTSHLFRSYQQIVRSDQPVFECMCVRVCVCIGVCVYVCICVCVCVCVWINCYYVHRRLS